MALIECPDCSNQISTEAYVCPKCGRPTGKRPMIKWKKVAILWAVLVVVFIAVWHFMGGGAAPR